MEFNRQYEELLVRPLCKIGFRTHGQSLNYTKDQTVLALLRFQVKFSAMTQSTHFLLCVRHIFLRSLEKELATRFLSCASEYPFKLPVSTLSRGMLKNWHYEPINLGPREYDTVRFGELSNASAILSNMSEKITNSGLVWMEYLTPTEALKQLKKTARTRIAKRFGSRTMRRSLSRTATDKRPRTS
jgi:hypothetical protein